MRFIAIHILVITLLCHTPQSVADERNIPLHDFMIDNQPLDNENLKVAFYGITHHGFYRFVRDVVPTRTFTETTFMDGTVRHKQSDEILTGEWNIKNNRICFRYYELWNQEMCFDIYRVGTCYYHVIRSSGGEPRFAWTARSTPENKEPDCDAPVA